MSGFGVTFPVEFEFWVGFAQIRKVHVQKNAEKESTLFWARRFILFRLLDPIPIFLPIDSSGEEYVQLGTFRATFFVATYLGRCYLLNMDVWCTFSAFRCCYGCCNRPSWIDVSRSKWPNHLIRRRTALSWAGSSRGGWTHRNHSFASWRAQEPCSALQQCMSGLSCVHEFFLCIVENENLVVTVCNFWTSSANFGTVLVYSCFESCHHPFVFLQFIAQANHEVSRGFGQLTSTRTTLFCGILEFVRKLTQ